MPISQDIKTCKICGAKDFNGKHQWSNHYLKNADYYHEYFPRFNKLTNKLIEFKSIDQYFSQDFANRTELAEWIKKHTKQEIFDYLVNFLKNRKIFKGITYFPGQFEAKTLIFPSISFLITKFGLEFIKELCIVSELQLKYNYNNLDFITQRNEIIIDSREKKILNFLRSDTKIGTLKNGDYKVLGNKQNIVVDRKALSDCIATVSKFERFDKELARAQKSGEYLIMMVEESFQMLNNFESLPWNHSKAKKDFIFHNMRELLQKYPNFQIVCIDGRADAAEFVEKIFNLQNDIKQIDLEYYVNQGLW